jgi:hypothetical protein
MYQAAGATPDATSHEQANGSAEAKPEGDNVTEGEIVEEKKDEEQK